MENSHSNGKRKKSKIALFFGILNFLVGLFLIYTIYLIAGIETKIRFVIMGVLLILNIVLLIISIKMSKKTKKAKIIIYIFITIILIAIQGYGAMFIYRTYDSVSNMNKANKTYGANVVVLKDSKLNDIKLLDNIKIGLVEDKTSVDNYILGKKIINDYNLSSKNNVLYYDDIYVLMEDLYNKKVDAIIISNTYIDTFSEVKDYTKISTDTKSIYNIEKKFTKKEISDLTGETDTDKNTSSIDKPFTALIMGVDSASDGLSKNSVGNGDTLIVITYNPKTLNLTILSIPRDSYVPIACLGNNERKINSAALYSESCMINTIENFLDINVDYYVKINFKGVVNLVDILGGVTVDVNKDICEQNSNRAWGSNTICLKKGVQTLNGEQALAYARHRKTYTTGDLQRGQNQQQVIQAMLNKFKEIKSPAQLLSILDTISKNMDTNLTTKQILSFYNIGKDLLATSNSESENFLKMQKLYIAGSGAMIYDTYARLVLWDYIVNTSSINAVKNAMKTNLELKTPTIIKTFTYSTNDKYEDTIIGQKATSGTTLYSLVPDFTKKTRSSALAWGTTNGVTINFTTVSENVSKYNDGQIINQSVPSNYRADKIGSSGITLTIVEKKTIITPPSTDITNGDNSDNSTDNTNNDTSDTGTNTSDN